jgi:hypothetical protein
MLVTRFANAALLRLHVYLCTQVEPMAGCLSRLLSRGLEVELCSRCAVLLLRAHQVCHDGSVSYSVHVVDMLCSSAVAVARCGITRHRKRIQFLNLSTATRACITVDTAVDAVTLRTVH